MPARAGPLDTGRRARWLPAGVVALMLAAGGCSTGTTDAPTSAAPTPESTPPTPFGKQLTVASGGTLTVAPPRQITPKHQCCATGMDYFFTAPVTYVNGPPSDITNNLDTVQLIASAYAETSDGAVRECQPVTDTEGSPSYQKPVEHLSPGETFKWDMAIGCAAAAGDTVTVSFNYGVEGSANTFYRFGGTLP